MVALPSVPPVAVNVPVVLPAGIVTLAGVKVTPPTGFEVSPTTVLTGAGALRVIVPGTLCVNPTPAAPPNPTVIVGVVTVTASLAAWNPGDDARMLVVPAATGVTITFAAVEFAGTITAEGTEITVGS
jgi:hypothetical protein